MRPALSIVFFTTLSGAGFGLLAWLGLAIASLYLGGEPVPWTLRKLQFWSLGIGLGLAALGLLSSLAHLGQPQRAWRALSQWRTSWLSREGVLALATMVLALVIGLALWRAHLSTPALIRTYGVLGMALTVLSLATVVCTAMIYASLVPIPAWRHSLVMPVYLGFAILTGLALLFVLILAFSRGNNTGAIMAITLTGLGAALVAAKWQYWRDLDRAPPPAERAAAVGLPEREVEVFERPHTEANYLTREMGFEVARRHAIKLRIGSSALIVLTPLLAWVLITTHAAPTVVALGIASFGLLLGAWLERWLFFAEAKHMVSAYY